MSKSAVSMFVFSIYLFVLGVVLLVVPNVLLSLFGFTETSEVWIRVVGMLVFFLGFYYNRAARYELKSFFRWTVYGRCGVLVFFIVFVVLGFAPAVLILFGVIDAAGALWTALCLRAERSA
jgi:hypothetical protein